MAQHSDVRTCHLAKTVPALGVHAFLVGNILADTFDGEFVVG